jgi:hypothetical protein
MLPRMTSAEPGTPVADPSPRPAATANDAVAEVQELPGQPALRGCPFLISEDGGWRLDMPSRDHRCAAFTPPAPLAPDKQARLCLTTSHLTCATYLASLAARETRLGSPPADRATRWGLARTTTVIEDPGGIRTRLLGLALDRRRWPAIPALLLVITLFTLAISGIRGVLPSTGVGASASPPPTLAPTAATAVLTPAPTMTPPPPTATPLPTLVPTGTASPTSAPAPKPTFRTYVVQSGDTLSAIAARFHTTVTAIAALNHISDPSRLRVGQVLKIPN